MVVVRIDLARKPSRLHLYLSPTYLPALGASGEPFMVSPTQVEE